MLHFYKNGDYLASVAISDEVNNGEHLAEIGIVPELSMPFEAVPDDGLWLKLREAWDIDGGHLVISITKAKNLRKQYLEKRIDSLLKEIDGRKIRAITDAIAGDPSRLQELESQAEIMRGIRSGLPVALASLSTAEAIDAYMPEGVE